MLFKGTRMPFVEAKRILDWAPEEWTTSSSERSLPVGEDFAAETEFERDLTPCHTVPVNACRLGNMKERC